MAVGENEYRYTEPAKLEVRMYKKRLHQEVNSDDEDPLPESRPSKRTKIDMQAPKGFVP